MKIKIIKSDNCWYDDLIGTEFIVQSESRKGGKGKYVVRLHKELRHLMNGYMYGWVEQEHCEIVEDNDDLIKEEFIKSMEIISQLADKVHDPIKLTSKQYEALKKRLGEKIDESDKDRLISNSLGRQVIIVD